MSERSNKREFGVVVGATPRGAWLARRLTAAALCAAIAVLAVTFLFSTQSPSRAAVGVRVKALAACPQGATARRSARALLAAVARYRLESRGSVIHADLRRIGRDIALLHALEVGNLRAALVAANRQLVHHVVRIRVLRGPRVLVDANSPSFDVAGSSIALRGPGGTSIGRLEITVQDFIGYVKLLHKINHVDVLVRGTAGHFHTSLAGAARLALPASGCVQVGPRRYAVRTLTETGFAGEPVVIRLLTSA